MIKVINKTFIDDKTVGLIGEHYPIKIYQDYTDDNDSPVWGNIIYVTTYDEVIVKIDISAGDNVSILDEYVVA